MKQTFTQILRTEWRLTMRDFFTVFFALVFPSLMLLIFGSIFGGAASPDGGSMLDSMVPAYSCMIIGVTGLMGFPLNLVSNMERGVYRRFDASPVGKNRIIWGELTANLLLTFVGLAVLFAFAWAVFGVAASGSWLAIMGALLLNTASTFALGYFLVAAALGTRVALTLCYTVYFIMLFLSGATLPRLLFNDTLLAVSDWLPLTYAVRLAQDAFNGTSVDLGKSILVLLCVTIGCGAAASVLFRRRT